VVAQRRREPPAGAARSALGMSSGDGGAQASRRGRTAPRQVARAGLSTGGTRRRQRQHAGRDAGFDRARCHARSRRSLGCCICRESRARTTGRWPEEHRVDAGTARIGRWRRARRGLHHHDDAVPRSNRARAARREEAEAGGAVRRPRPGADRGYWPRRRSARLFRRVDLRHLDARRADVQHPQMSGSSVRTTGITPAARAAGSWLR